VLRKEASAPRVTPPKEKPSVSPRAYQWTARWIVIGLAALVTAGTQHFLFRESSGALWKLDALAWRQGVYADALILWWEFWANRTLGVLALVFGPGLFAAWWIKKFEARLILKLREWNFSAPRSLGLLAVFCSVLALGWALWIGFVYGQGPAQWQASLGLRQWIQSGEKSGDSLKQLGAPLRGSSFYFRELFLHNRARVVAECGGQGPDAEWDKKRVCLMLLFASMAEAVEQARPVILRVPAARAAVLSSLDGILRVMRVEGRDSALLPFFLNALAQLGLQSERDDLHRIVFMSRLDADQIQSLLVELRFQIEKDLLSSQKNSVPPGMTLYVRSPLEEGI
jgi:hypothetical protein